MVLQRLLGGITQLVGGALTSRGSAVTQELAETNKCLSEIKTKRERALRRKNQVDSRGRPTLINWEEDDRYADDRFYQKKLEECYDRHSSVRKTMAMR